MSSKRLVRKVSCTEQVIAKRLFEVKFSLCEIVVLKKPLITKFLIEYGCEVNSHDPSTGLTALHMSVHQSCFDNVKVLIEHGADVNIKAQNGLTPLCVHKFATDHPDKHKILKLLLDSGASLYGHDDQGHTTITYLLFDQSLETLRILLQYNMDLNAQDNRGQTPIHQLISRRTPNFTDELRDREFMVDLTDNSGQTALSYAVQYYNLKAVELLLRRGANVNSQCKLGYTPLFYALKTKVRSDVRDEVLRIIETLLHYNADIQHTFGENVTIFSVGVNTNNIGLLEPIIAHLAMLMYLGIPIKENLWTHLQEYPEIIDMISKYYKLLEIMTKYYVYGSVTLFKLLTEPDEKIIRYMRNPKLVLRLNRLDMNCRFDMYYIRVLRRRINKAICLSRLRQRACLAISKIIMMPDLVTENILYFVNEDSLRQLCRLIE